MSAEAADREAATSSRPCTPPQTCWFEFLLEESLLEKHLRKPCPGERGAGGPRGAGPGHGAARRASRRAARTPRCAGGVRVRGRLFGPRVPVPVLRAVGHRTVVPGGGCLAGAGFPRTPGRVISGGGVGGKETAPVTLRPARPSVLT